MNAPQSMYASSKGQTGAHSEHSKQADAPASALARARESLCCLAAFVFALVSLWPLGKNKKRIFLLKKSDIRTFSEAIWAFSDLTQL
jgi:hypothetical protein